MKTLEEKIMNVSGIIERNIDLVPDKDLVVQNILKYLRDMVELFALMLYSKEKGECLELSFQINKQAINNIKNSDYKYLKDFYDRTNDTTSHRTHTDETAWKILYFYMDYISKLKSDLLKEFNLEVIPNLDKIIFPKSQITHDYYKSIIHQINNTSITLKTLKHAVFYILGKKPIYINGNLYFELTVVLAVSKSSKSEKQIIYTKIDMDCDYAMEIAYVESEVNFFGITNIIVIAVGMKISIRDCEFKNFVKLFQKIQTQQSFTVEGNKINNFLNATKQNLLDIIDSSDVVFNQFLKEIKGDSSQTFSILQCLEKTRKLDNGKNIIRYLLLTMENDLIKDQYQSTENKRLSNLYIDYKSIPFDQMPFCSNPAKNNAIKYNVYRAVDKTDREHEIFAKTLIDNAEENFIIYNELNDSKKSIKNFVEVYNNSLYYKHKPLRSIKEFEKFLYIVEYENNLMNIIKKFVKWEKDNPLNNWGNLKTGWLNENSKNLNKDKCDVFNKIFEEEKFHFLYGSAGTGKTTLIKYIVSFFCKIGKKKILALAKTNSAVNNLSKIIDDKDVKFTTLDSLKKNFSQNATSEKYDLVILDECSTVDNKIFSELLTSLKSEFILCSGDELQIESIKYGNWFSFCKKLFKCNVTSELRETNRTQNELLKKVWKQVREKDSKIAFTFISNNLIKDLNEEVFNCTQTNEIVLCLAYDGLFGVNNFNRIFQMKNQNKSTKIGLNIYKVGDPVCFNSNSHNYRGIYNNLRGTIIGIKEDISNESQNIVFQIQIEDQVINPFEYENIKIFRNNNKNLICEITVEKKYDLNKEETSHKILPPFDIAYAMSIHKAQGLEFDSVKVIIPDEYERLVSKNTFYTAVTRAKNNLLIFSNTEVFKKIVDNFEENDHSRTYRIIQEKLSLEFEKSPADLKMLDFSKRKH